MSAPITVTRAQVAAAQLQIELADELGETVTPAVRAIANARPSSSLTPRNPAEAMKSGRATLADMAAYLESIGIVPATNTRGPAA